MGDKEFINDKLAEVSKIFDVASLSMGKREFCSVLKRDYVPIFCSETEKQVATLWYRPLTETDEEGEVVETNELYGILDVFGSLGVKRARALVSGMQPIMMTTARSFRPFTGPNPEYNPDNWGLINEELLY